MKKTSLMLVGVVVSMMILSGTVNAATAFASKFTVKQITGECLVKKPGADKFTAAKEGAAYAYGTVLKTGRKASAVVVFAPNNECRVLAQTLVAIQEKATPSDKLLNLTRGQVKVK